MYNSMLSECDVESICQYLVAPVGFYQIYDNANGCNSPQEVREACGVGLDESAAGSQQPAVNIYPNPSSSLITVETPATAGKNTFLTIFNISGQQIISHQITKQLTAVDLSGLPQGIYFVRIKDDKTVRVEKIIRQ
jgi:hypothetical protein